MLNQNKLPAPLRRMRCRSKKLVHRVVTVRDSPVSDATLIPLECQNRCHVVCDLPLQPWIPTFSACPLSRMRSLLQARVPLEEFNRQIIGSRFVASPGGNGLDTYRTWQALYLGRVPIVDTAMRPDIFADLPVLVVDDWTKVVPHVLPFIRICRAVLSFRILTWIPQTPALLYWQFRICSDVKAKGAFLWAESAFFLWRGSALPVSVNKFLRTVPVLPVSMS